jgi:hypothetical protein
MRPPRVSVPVIVSALLVLGSASSGVGDQAKSSEKTKWKITGELEESCSCNGACPCWFGNKPTKMNCSGGQVVFIKKGNYGSVPLDGLALGEWVQSPDGKTMMESVGDWNFSHVYVDAKATPEQQKALQAIAAQVLPPEAPEKRTVRTAAITRKVDGKEHSVAIEPYLNFSAHLLEGGDGGPPKIMNPPMADPMHKEYSQGVTTHQKYDDGAKWDFENSNYMYNEFTVTSEDYEKYAEKMEKTMKAGEKK